jgi:type IV pilus assembly protein PilQ
MLIGMTLVLSCAPRSSQVMTRASSLPEIQAVEVSPGQDKTTVVVAGEEPILYTAFNVEDPDRLVIDLPGVGLGTFTRKIVPDGGPILSILPRGGDKKSQLEITLLQDVETDVRTDGNNLIIEVAQRPPQDAPDRTVSRSAAKTDAVSVSTQLAQFAPSSGSPSMAATEIVPPASTVTEVYFDRKEGLRLVVTSDGRLSPKHFLLGKDRLVIDLPNVKSRIKLKSIPVEDSAVRQARVGRHSDKVRLVVDLVKPVIYSLRQEGTRLMVHLRPASEGASTFRPSGQEDRETRPMVSAPMVSAASVSAPDVPAAPTAPPIISPLPAAPVASAMPVVPVGEGAIPPGAKASPSEVEPIASLAVKSAVEEVPQGKKYVGKKISMDFQDADISHVIRLIADVSGLNVVLADDVKGKVTLKLVEVPWDQAFDIVLKTNNLGQRRDTNIVQVATLANLTKQQDEEAKAKESQVKAEDQVTRILYVNYSKAGDLAESLRKSLSPRGDITVDARTNTLIVKDIPSHVEDVTQLAKTLDTQTPQVLIEARVVQVAPTFNKSLGIQWGANYQDNANANRIGLNTGTTGAFGASIPDFAVNLPAAPSFGGVGFTFGRLTSNPINLDLRLSAGESQGLTRIVSTPKVTVLDNQEAKIAQGESIPYATTSADGTQTTFVDANLSLLVTPRISPDGSILMKINITKNSPGPVQPGASGPSILKKEASTNVLVKDGETTVIGGIYETTDIDSTSGVPYLMKLPIIGNLFKKTEKREATSELLVFLTPKVVK